MESERGTDTFLGEVLFYARVAKKGDIMEYERLKRMIADLNLSPYEYGQAINKLVDILEI